MDMDMYGMEDMDGYDEEGNPIGDPDAYDEDGNYFGNAELQDFFDEEGNYIGPEKMKFQVMIAAME
jgi:hypothetical protein